MSAISELVRGLALMCVIFGGAGLMLIFVQLAVCAVLAALGCFAQRVYEAVGIQRRAGR